MRALVTGSAGFIGFHLARRLLADGHEVIGLDGFTPYYDVRLKRDRHAILARSERFRPVEAMLEDGDALLRLGGAERPDVVLHLAAQAGVRYSVEHPRAYVDANLVGTFNVLELARQVAPRHLLIASTSSVYGSNASLPFRETDRTDHPLTLYAATKKAGEAMAHAYAHLWKLPTTVFRFFTVYGPWGRPDMALFKFVAAILEGRPIEIYGNGAMRRDFTFVDDLVEAIVRLVDVPPGSGPVTAADAPAAPFRAVNIAGGRAVGLLDYVAAIERHLGRPALRHYVGMQQGDVPNTLADPAVLDELVAFRPGTDVDHGVKAFVDWYRGYYGVPGA